MKQKDAPESVVRQISRQTRKQYSSEEKIRIVFEGLRGEETIAAICRCEGFNPNLYYKGSKNFLQAGKRRLNGDTIREADGEHVNHLRKENNQLKQLVAELFLKNRVFKNNEWFWNTLVDQNENAGHKVVHWNFEDSRGLKCASGQHLISLKTDRNTAVRKVTLVQYILSQ